MTNYPGTQDRFTADILLRQWVLARLQDVYRDMGFNLLETPCLEPIEVLKKSGGVGDQPTFVFVDKHKDDVCLKPDQTVSLRRVVNQHRIRTPYPRHQVGLAFRQDKPEKGRLREFLQCDADVVGAPLGTADAETITWLLKGFAAVGLGETILSINSRSILSGLYERAGDQYFDETTFVRAIDKIPATGETYLMTDYLAQLAIKHQGWPAVPEDCTAFEMIPVSSVPGQAIAKILTLVHQLRSYRNEGRAFEDLTAFAVAFPELAGHTDALKGVVDMAVESGADPTRLSFDPVLARGMDYYTGPVFEARNPLWPYGSLAGGGRYDNMVVIDDVPQPSVGASFGLDRIEQALKDLERLPAECSARMADALVITKPDWLPGAMRVARQLREAGLKTFVYPDPTVTLKLQTRYAAQNSIPCAVFFGPDEQEQGTVTIREITPERDVADPEAARQAKNVTVALDQMVDTVRSLG